MPDCYYTCNLLPLDLLFRSGYSPRWLGHYLSDPAAPARRDALTVHPMTCPYVTKLVAAADTLFAGGAGDDCLVIPGGCDAMRRMGDLLAVTYPERVFVIPMPRSSAPEAAQGLATDLRRLADWLCARAPGAADKSLSAPPPVAAPQSAPRVDYPAPPEPTGVFVVAGPLTDDSLLRLIGRLGAQVSGLESCTSPDRWKPLSTVAGDDYAALATQLLEVGMCPRRSTSERRAYLVRRLEEAQPSSVIYARQSFCDPGAYDALLVAQLAGERGLPYLEIEVDFPFDANGPLHTRVEAFLEAQLLDDDLLDEMFGGDNSGQDRRGVDEAPGKD